MSKDSAARREPVVSAEVVAPRGAVASEEAVARRKILIADDAPLFRELGALFLSRSGEVATVNNGFEALAHAQADRPDVVVADLDMPCMGGAELCRRLRSDPDLHDVPVVLVTSGERAEDRARAVRAGADDVIGKPIHRAGLIQTVNRLLRFRGRGLARVSLAAEVRIQQGPARLRGRAVNLSRGGIFVESEGSLPPTTEVRLEFQLPDAAESIAPTAEVVWRREGGMGMRFLALDGSSARRIDHFVHESGGGR